MIEDIYIDGEQMDLTADKTNVQLIYQSPVLVDFQNITSNRTTQVSLPMTRHNLRVIGYTGTQAVSDFAYLRHSVIYRRDGVQLLNGNAVLLSIGNGSITMCFTWGNVTAMQTLFDTSLRDLTLARPYCNYPATNVENRMLYIQYGGGRLGVGVAVKDVLSAMETQCGVTGLQALADTEDGRQYVLAQTGRNGDTRTKELQGAVYGVPTARMWEAANLFYLTTLVGDGTRDPHGYLNEYGIMDVSGASTLRVRMQGTLDNLQYGTASKQQTMKLVGDDGNGWDYVGGVTIATPTAVGQQGGVNIMRYTCNYDQTIDVSGYERVCIAITADVGNYNPQLSNVNMTYDVLIPDPDQPEEVIYGTGLTAYPVALNLPDMTCGQFIKNLLWMQGKFAYSADGRTFALVGFNELAANKAKAVDWTEKVNMPGSRSEEFKTTLQDTAQRNVFRWAEADDYDNTQYEGVMVTEDETIEPEREYCKSAFALSPTDRIPVWTLNDGEWDYDGDGQPVRMLIGKAGLLFHAQMQARYDEQLRWQWILDNRYGPYADIIRRPEQLKVRAVLTTYDLYALDLTIPVYLRQTGHYYLIRKLSVKGGMDCDVELIKI